MNRAARILLCAAAVFLCLTGSAMAASGQHEVTADKLYFRKEPAASAETIGRLNRGEVVTVLSTEDGWAKVHWAGQTGYLSCEYLEKITAASKSGSNTTSLSGTAWLEKDASLYAAADTASDQICRLTKGTQLILRGETLNFYYVTAEGKTGYLLKNRVAAELNEKAVKTAAPAEKSAAQTTSILRTGDSGSAVSGLQQRLSELGYLDEKYVTGYYGDITRKAVLRFQTLAGLDTDGVTGPATMKKLDSGSAPKMKEIVEKDWFDSDVSKSVYKRGGTAYIIDCETGIRIKIRRVGGSNHMDVEPAEAEDTEKLLKIYGGSWSWDQRAVILIADGEYIAASINGMPHGAEISTDNNFEGQFCLHTTGSMTHGTEKVNGRHQEKIEEALNYMN